MANHEEFLKKLRKTFRIEASEGIANITTNLIALEKEQSGSKKTALIEAAYRDAHSLKGAARAVNMSEIEMICQSLESVFSALKNNFLETDAGVFDLFHLTLDLLNELVNNDNENTNNGLQEKVSELLQNLTLASTGNYISSISSSGISKNESNVVAKDEPKSDEILSPLNEVKDEPKFATQKSENTIRISTVKLDNLLFQVEEMIGLKQSLLHLNNMLKVAGLKLKTWSDETSEVFPLIQKILQAGEVSEQHQNKVLNKKEAEKVTQFFEWASSMLKTIEDEIDYTSKLSAQESYHAGVKIESLLEEVKKIISVPFSTIVDVMPKAARDISKATGKEINVVIKGVEIELDQRILEELRNPLMHLLRNSIDHGIEKPHIRIQKNKPIAGTIEISVERLENNRVEIILKDDGAGIELEKVRQKYIEQENISPEKANEIGEQALLDFLFRSGISTRETVTVLSGRGLGLAIVKEKIEQLGGIITVKSKINQGTQFKIDIPLSLVTIRGVQIVIGDRDFIVPTSRINKVFQIDKSEMKTIENKANFNYLGEIIPIVYLCDLLEIPHKENHRHDLLMLILGPPENQFGFVIDSILGEDVILVKKFNEQMKRVRHISGATVLGSGKVVPILNVSDLLKSAVIDRTPVSREIVAQESEKKRAILVVEDSITSRMLLKNILESSGYLVTTAIDGVDGFNKLKAGAFDLVVSDVDMPRMSGLDLTAKIRADKAVSEIPVILVTSLSKREDQERGLEVGANAYIVKGNFDQSNLTDVVERIIGN
jgi:two-component system chemotaxis sensor kinase CheA